MQQDLDGYVVLVADDEVMIAMDLAEQLENAGAVVIGPTCSVKGALALLDGAATDAAVLDVVLGDELVYPLADILLDRQIPFIFATGFGAETLPQKYAGIPVCVKPFTPDSFIRAIFSALHNNSRLAAA